MNPAGAVPEQSFERYRDYLHLLARLQLATPLQAKIDVSGVIQVTLLEAYQAQDQLRGQGEAQRTAWLRRIFINNLADELRKLAADKRDVTPKYQLELWDLSAANPVKCWQQELNYGINTREVCWSPDGKLVAATAYTGSLWDATTGVRRKLDDLAMVVTTTPEHTHYQHYSIHKVLFSPDSKLLFAGAESGRLGVADVQTGKSLGLWKGHEGDVFALAISPDGKTLASGSEDRTIALWDVATRTELARWEAHEASVTALTYSADGKALISGAGDGTLKLWDLPRIRRELATLGLDW